MQRYNCITFSLLILFATALLTQPNPKKRDNPQEVAQQVMLGQVSNEWKVKNIYSGLLF